MKGTIMRKKSGIERAVKVVSKIENAMNVIGRELENDPEYRITWQANIAMAFVDNWQWYKDRNKIKRPLNRKERHAVANEAANYFLNLAWPTGAKRRAPKETP